MKLKIDPEFESLIPPLTADEYRQLEANILQDGCRDALVSWNGFIVDGHNRNKICEDHNIPFNTQEKHFDCREDAIIWICQNQRGRRNITDEQRKYLMGKEYQANIKKQGSNNQYVQKSEKPEKQDFQERGATSHRIAEQYGVGHDTVERNSQFAKGIDKIAEQSPQAKQTILSGQVKIPKAEVREIRNKPADEIREIAKQIETGTYERPKTISKSESYKEAEKALTERMQQSEALGDADIDGRTLIANIQTYTRSIKALIPSIETMQEMTNPVKDEIMASACQLEETMISLKKMIEEI